MAKQIIDIGVQGNDGTGDGIRESFRKVNENFTEIYSVLGIQGAIPFTKLSDAPSDYDSNQVIVANNEGNRLTARDLVAGTGISIDASDDTQIVITASNSAPTLEGPVNAAGFTIGNLAEPTQAMVDAFNAVYGPLGTTIPNVRSLAMTRGYADDSYLSKSGSTNQAGTLTATNLEVVQSMNLHMGQISDVGNPIYDQDAATKFYVDNSAFASQVNLFVSSSGDDEQTVTPIGKEGRSFSHSYRTIRSATQYAEKLIEQSVKVPNSYKQLITYDNGSGLNFSTVESAEFINGNSTTVGYTNAYWLIEHNKNFLVEEVAAYAEDQFNDLLPFSILNYRAIVSSLINATLIDLITGGTFLTINSAKDHYYEVRANASDRTELNANDIEVFTYFKTVVLQVLNNTTTTRYQNIVSQTTDLTKVASVPAKTAVTNNLTSFIDITTDGADTAPSTTYGTGSYRVRISNGSSVSVTQGDPANCEIIPGKLLQGVTSSAIGNIVSYTAGDFPVTASTVDTFELNLTTPILFEVGETLEFGHGVPALQISIFVESGTYEEDFPIRVPPNVSIIGDDKERTIVQPANRTSESELTQLYFFRNLTLDLLELTSTNYGRHYLTDPTDTNSSAKNNKSIDTFLLNDSSVIKNLSISGHGGFAAVLDPAGNIVNNLPEVVNCLITSRVDNTHVTRGGAYIDGFAGRLRGTVASVTNSGKTINLTGGYGLQSREPHVPSVFYENGVKYKVISITSYTPLTGNTTIHLDPQTPYTTAPGNVIILEPAGFIGVRLVDTVIKADNGYGVVAANTGFADIESVKTEYCHAGLYSKLGGQIKSNLGTTAYGNYGLKSVGNNLNVSSGVATTSENLSQGVTAYTTGSYTNASGDICLYVTSYSYLPRGQSEIEVVHGTTIKRYFITNVEEGGDLPVGVAKLNLGQYQNNLSPDFAITTDIPNGTPMSVRCLGSINFSVTSEIVDDQSIIFNDDSEISYRVISVDNSVDGYSLVNTREHYNYIDVTSFITQPASHGSAGDTKIAVYNLSATDRDRCVGYQFVWKGNTYTITSYDTPTVTGALYGRLNFTPALVDSTVGFSSPLLLRAGPAAGSSISIISEMSVIYAINHTFDNIGTGGINTANIPNRINGAPTSAASQDKEILEQSAGVVIYTTTDQDGVFRVGRYFSVDQNTGTISISGSAALTNIDGLGFKRGVVINEFSTDDSLTANSVDVVPTQSAVRNYVDRRLGKTHAGSTVSNSRLIGPGYLPLDGTLPMKGNLNLSGNRGVNFDAPENLTDAANKYYVDYVNWVYRRLSRLEDVDLDLNTPITGTISYQSKVQNAPSSWLVTYTFTGQPSHPVGTMFMVENVRPLGYNGVFTSTARTLTSVTLQYTTDPGAFSNGVLPDGIKLTAITSNADMLIYNGMSSMWNNATMTGDGTLAYANGLLRFIIPAGTVTRQQMANISTGKVLGNTTGTSTYPQEVSLTTVVTKGFDGVLSDSGAITFTAGSPNTYSSTPISAVSAANSLVKTTASGAIHTRKITTGLATTTGTITGTWGLTAGSRLNATYADLAEYYSSDAEYEPGTVLVFGGDAETTTTKLVNDTRLAGVVTTDPAYVMNEGLEGTRVCIALQGRVPCKVLGRVKKGDMLTTSATPGYAVKALTPTLGAVVGKALEDKDYGELGVIEVAVGRT